MSQDNTIGVRQPQFQAVEALTSSSTKLSQAEQTSAKLPSGDSVAMQLTDKPQVKVDGAKDFIDKSTLASLKIGVGSGLIAVGGTASILLAPLTLTGGLIGIGLQNLAGKLGLVDKSNTNISKAGFIIGSLGTLGIAMIGTKLLQSGNQMKADLAKSSAAESPKTEKPAEKTTENANSNSNTVAPRKESEIFTDIKSLKEMKNKTEDRLSDHKNELREAKSQINQLTTLRDHSLEIVSKDKTALNERLEHYLNVKDSTLPGLFKEYEGKKTISEKEQFISDLKKSGNSHTETLEVVHSSRLSIDNESKTARSYQLQIDKIQESNIPQIEKNIQKEKNNLNALKNEEQTLYKEIVKEQINQILGRFLDPGQALKALSGEYQRQGRFLNDLQTKHTNTLETNPERYELQEKMTMKTIFMEQLLQTMNEMAAAPEQAKLGSPLNKTGPVLNEELIAAHAKTISEDQTTLRGGTEVERSGERVQGAPLENTQVKGVPLEQKAETLPEETLKPNKLSVEEKIETVNKQPEKQLDTDQYLDDLLKNIDDLLDK